MFDYAAHKVKLCDTMGRRLTSGLFVELADPTTASPPVFTLAEWRKTYVAIADPTDYKAAMELIGDWDHWLLLASNPKFKEHLELWREEVQVKIKSESVAKLKKLASSPQGTAAAKYLAEAGYLPKKQKKNNKDNKQEPDFSIAEDAKRLGLRAVK